MSLGLHLIIVLQLLPLIPLVWSLQKQRCPASGYGFAPTYNNVSLSSRASSSAHHFHTTLEKIRLARDSCAVITERSAGPS